MKQSGPAPVDVPYDPLLAFFSKYPSLTVRAPLDKILALQATGKNEEAKVAIKELQKSLPSTNVRALLKTYPRDLAAYNSSLEDIKEFQMKKAHGEPARLFNRDSSLHFLTKYPKRKAQRTTYRKQEQGMYVTVTAQQMSESAFGRKRPT